ncbi:MAG: UDP-3-O-(3-hydroxymyristoyl)glucosamine N-acyltransferase [Rhodobacteraceae bacterium]|nr:UDP-3-O-(3-hydroxymyristoyl)glucosamine N-acyltransferase [Paracoccaceae bacterium]
MASTVTHYSVSELARIGQAQAHGDGRLVVTGLADAAEAGPDDLAIAFSPDFHDALRGSRARAALLGHETDWQELGLAACITAERPRYAWALIARRFTGHDVRSGAIAESAVVASSARLGMGCTIGAFTVIDEDVVIGDGAVIGCHVTIGAMSRIGANAVIGNGVRIGARVVAGDNVLIEDNSVIGSSGFSYETAEEGVIEEVKQTFGNDSGRPQGSYTRIPSLGGVVIGDHVEIGSGCCIDRGTLSNTRIGSGTKLDNLVHIAHNVQIGSDCLICGQVGIAGSAVLGDRVILAGKTGIKDHIEIGNDVIAAGASQIYSNVPDGQRVMGSPAVTMQKSIEIYRALRRLPRLMRRVATLEAVRKGPAGSTGITTET